MIDRMLAAYLGRRIAKRAAQPAGYVAPRDRQQFAWLSNLLQARMKAQAPKTFTIDNALELPAVATAVDVLATEVSSSDMRVEQLTNGVWEAVEPTDPEARLVTGRWSEYEGAEVAVERLMRSVLLYGFAAAFIRRRRGGAAPRELIPLDPNRVTRKEDTSGNIVYTFDRGPRHRIVPQTIPRRNLIWLEFVPAFNRVDQVSPLAHQWTAIRAGIGALRWTNSYWDSGATGELAFVPGGQVSPDVEHGNEYVRKLMNEMREAGGREFVVPSGYTVQSVSGDPRSTALVELSLHALQNVARIYRLPPITLGDLSKSTYTNYPSAVRSLNRTVGRWGLRLGREISTALWPGGERRLVFAQDDTYSESFRDLSGGLKDRVFAGIMSQNEARAVLKLPRHDSEEADALARTQMLVSMDFADEAGNAPPPEPEPPTTDDEGNDTEDE